MTFNKLRVFNIYQKVCNKFNITAKIIANDLGAVGAFGYMHDHLYQHGFISINPKYDITNKIIDKLNEEYIAEISNI